MHAQIALDGEFEKERNILTFHVGTVRCNFHSGNWKCYLLQDDWKVGPIESPPLTLRSDYHLPYAVAVVAGYGKCVIDLINAARVRQ